MAAVPEGGKEAFTEYQVIGRGGGCTLVKVRLHTGRTHQIRVHFAEAGHPVVGDVKYGAKKAKRLCLRAVRLVFVHPFTGKRLVFEVPS